MIKLTNFGVMCKAYGGEPSVDLLRSFLNLGRAGDRLTLFSREGADVPKALMKPVTHLKNWKGSFFNIKNKVIPSSFPELLLEDNKFDKKSFKDKIPLLPQMDPLYDQISTYPCNIQTFLDPILYLAGIKTSWKYFPKNPVIYHHGQGVDGEFNFLPEEGLDENRRSTKSVNNEAPVINGGLSPIGPDAPSYLEAGKKLKVSRKRKVVVGSHGEDPHGKAHKVPAQASKVARDASTPLDVDSDPDIHEFPSAKELKDATNYHWVISHVTPPFWKASCDTNREREIKKDKAYAELDKNSQVNGLHSEYSRLILEEKKWINYEQTLSTLRAKVEGLRSKGKRLKASEI
ncbi:hypothetical protein Tco_0715113 [Tanacetum coccineum]